MKRYSLLFLSFLYIGMFFGFTISYNNESIILSQRIIKKSIADPPKEKRVDEHCYCEGTECLYSYASSCTTGSDNCIPNPCPVEPDPCDCGGSAS